MTNHNKDFNDSMSHLDRVPEVKEHSNKFEVRLATKIIKRRLDLQWTQSRLIEVCKLQGFTVTQTELGKIESGMNDIDSKVYLQVYNILYD